MPRTQDRSIKRKARKANERPVKKAMRRRKRERKNGQIPFVVQVSNGR